VENREAEPLVNGPSHFKKPSSDLDSAPELDNELGGVVTD